MNSIQKADIFAARLLLMCFFLPVHIQVYSVFATCIYFVVRTFIAEQAPPTRHYWWALLLGGGYLFYLLAVPLTPPHYRHAVLSLCERKVSYLLLPFVFAIMAPGLRRLVIGHMMYFVYGCIIACVLGNLDFAYHHFIVEAGANALSHVHYRMIFERFTGIHPTYMSIYLCFAICITSMYAVAKKPLQRLLKFSIIYVLLVFMLALFAKSPLLALGIIALHALYMQRHSLRKFGWVFLSLGGVVAGAFAFIPFFRQRATEMLGLFDTGSTENITQNSVHIRKLIWSTDTGMLRHYWLTGTGPGRMLDLLHQRYFFHSIYRGYWVGYFDPHNQYFSDWLSFGIIGIIALVVALFIHFRQAVRSKNSLYLYLLIILALSFFTETMLARQQGVVFYGVFTSLFFFASAKKDA